ncbi:MAG: hypothetical protein IPJ41_14300 [Phycisphaerales bacterium]|nr:hypothetical protein [Phycisphaerales bacterium]
MAKTNSRAFGRPLAVILVICCIAAVGFITLRAVTAPPPAPPGAGDGSGFSHKDISRSDDELGSARGLHIQMVDPEDRKRLAAELETETLDPLQAQRYRVGRPSATIYLADGRLVHITSESGTLVLPDRTKPPETGTLTGDVVVRLFDARADGRRPDPQHDLPSMVWKGKSLTFDSTLGEASTNEPFVLTTAQIEFRADDAKLLINQALQRLERFTVRKGGTIVYHDLADPMRPSAGVKASAVPAGGSVLAASHASRATPALRSLQATPDPDRQPGAADDLAASPAPAVPREPVVTFYQAVARGTVELVRGGQRIESDRLDLFARTIDNKLPKDAIGAIRPASEPPAASQPEPSAFRNAMPRETAGPAVRLAAYRPQPEEADSASQVQAPATQPTVPDAEAPEEESTTLTWKDDLEVRPLLDEPQELRENHLVARFTADQSGVVRFSDSEAEASGQAAVFEYSLTTRDLVLSGPAQENVLLTSKSMGQARMARFELPLSTGIGRVIGPGTVIGSHSDRVDWRERTNLVFKMDGERMSGELLEAECIGSARATDGNAWIEADNLHVYFDDQLDGQSRPTRLVAQHAVRLGDGRGADGAWESLEVAFDPMADHPAPTSVDAGGGGSFRDQTARVAAEHIFAELREDDEGKSQLARVWADGQVKFTRFTDKIEVEGERLFADVDEQLLEVQHPGGTSRVARGPTVITGERVRLHGQLRTAEAYGPGSFEHQAGAGETRSSIRAVWTDGMAFDDIAGKLECVGGVVAVHQPDPLTRESISGALVRVEFESSEAGEPGADAAAFTNSSDGGDRAVRTLYAGGEAVLGTGEKLATVESTRSSTPPVEGQPAPPVERAFRLSGVEIFADNEAGTLDVPGRGRLFVADLRPTPEGRSESNDRGASLFDWNGSFHADRAVGSAEMLDSVRMSHSRAVDGSKTLLECAKLRAFFIPGDKPEKIFAGLRSAVAETDAYLRTESRELSADTLLYDPDTGVAKAVGIDGHRVRILDRTTGSPISAAALVWDLNADRVDVVDPGTIVIPR